MKNLSQIDVLSSPKCSPIYYIFHFKAVLILSKIKSFAYESGVKKKFVVRCVAVFVLVFVNRVQKTPKGNLPCGKFFWTKFVFQIAISQPLIGAPSRYLHHIKTYIQGIQNDILHHHMVTTPHTMSFKTRENVFIENFLSMNLYLKKL